MSIITRMLKQTCVYWAFNSFDNSGFPTWINPVELDCRWEDVNEEFVGANETKMLSKSKVYVESDVDVAGVLMLGTLTDISSNPDDVKENDGAYEIRRFDKTPNLKATEFLRMAWL